MLSELQILNFAIIEEQTISFIEGLNVITGETGAGKSIILNAIELILGGRAKANLIRKGADFLEVNAVFDLSRIDRKIFSEMPDIVQGDELLISRNISQSGKSKIYINGKISTLSFLEEITSKIINICGQSNQVRLLDPQYHLSLLDDFADLLQDVNTYKVAHEAYKLLENQLNSAEQRNERNAEIYESLQFTYKELSSLNLKLNIRADLESEIKRLANSEKLIEKIDLIVNTITGDDSVILLLNKISQDILEISKLDKSLSSDVNTFKDSVDLINEVATNLVRYSTNIELDESKLEQLREQLAEIARLERKYKTDDAGLLKILDKIDKELQNISDPKSLEKLKVESLEAQISLFEISYQLSNKRKKAGIELSKKVQEELAELNMPYAYLSLSLQGKLSVYEEIGKLIISKKSSNKENIETIINQLKEQLQNIIFYSSGIDKGEFLFSSNKGETEKPLRQIASGGELSRIMLILKKILRDRSGVNVLVFDEVDTGVSGSVARAVGQKLKSLADMSQVICITHLPQVASFADAHILVEKVVGERTNSEVKILNEEERVYEIARMIAGYKVTEASKESARELLNLRFS